MHTATNKPPSDVARLVMIGFLWFGRFVAAYLLGISLLITTGLVIFSYICITVWLGNPLATPLVQSLWLRFQIPRDLYLTGDDILSGFGKLTLFVSIMLIPVRAVTKHFFDKSLEITPKRWLVFNTILMMIAMFVAGVCALFSPIVTDKGSILMIFLLFWFIGEITYLLHWLLEGGLRLLSSVDWTH